MKLIKELKAMNDLYFFWDQVSKQQPTPFQVYLGTVKFNVDLTNVSLVTLVNELISDFQKKTTADDHYFKLFYDTDNQNQPLLHYLLISSKDSLPEFKSTLMYAISKVNQIDDDLINYKNLINHYLGYHDYYGYQRVKSWVGNEPIGQIAEDSDIYS